MVFLSRLISIAKKKVKGFFLNLQIVIDFIPHVRSHFETVYHERKNSSIVSVKSSNNEFGSPSTSTTSSTATSSAAETKQMEALQRQFDQVKFNPDLFSLKMSTNTNNIVQFVSEIVH